MKEPKASLTGRNRGDKLLKHGGIIFSATLVSFFFAYIYHFYMARALGPESYGILGSMLSLIYIFSVPSSVIMTTLAQMVSEINGKGDYGGIKSILFLSLRKLAIIGLLIFISLVLVSPLLKNILSLPSELPVVLLGFSLIFMTMLPSPRGVLQGMQEFTGLGLNIAFEKPVLLFSGVVLVNLGMGVSGAILSFGIASAVVLALALIPLRSIFGTKNSRVELSAYKYASPIFILIFCITIMDSVDILFVRRFFAAEVSGYFTAMKMLGQVVYFLSIALGGVLVPKVSELNSLNKMHSFLLRKALIYFGIFLAVVISAYLLASDMIIVVLFGDGYSSISPYLVWYTFAMAMLSLAIIFMFYDVSAKRMAFRYPLIIFTLMYVILLFIFHATIEQVIAVEIAVFFMLLVTVILINRRFCDA